MIPATSLFDHLSSTIPPPNEQTLHVFVCACVRACTCMHDCVHKHMRERVHACVCLCIWVYACLHVCPKQQLYRVWTWVIKKLSRKHRVIKKLSRKHLSLFWYCSDHDPNNRLRALTGNSLWKTASLQVRTCRYIPRDLEINAYAPNSLSPLNDSSVLIVVHRRFLCELKVTSGHFVVYFFYSATV